MLSKGQFVGLDWSRIPRLYSQVMTGTQELTNSIALSHLSISRCSQPTSLRIPPSLFRQCLSSLPMEYIDLYNLRNIEASTVLCSVVRHAGDGRTRKKCRAKHETKQSASPYFLTALPVPNCFTTKYSTIETSFLL